MTRLDRILIASAIVVSLVLIVLVVMMLVGQRRAEKRFDEMDPRGLFQEK